MVFALVAWGFLGVGTLSGSPVTSLIPNRLKSLAPHQINSLTVSASSFIASVVSYNPAPF